MIITTLERADLMKLLASSVIHRGKPGSSETQSNNREEGLKLRDEVTENYWTEVSRGIDLEEA